MAQGTSSLRLDPVGDDFMLRRAGARRGFRLSGEDVLTLAQSASFLRDRVLSRYNPTGEGVVPVIATPVADATLGMDALGENLLLALEMPSGERVVFSVPRHKAAQLAASIPWHLAREAEGPPTRQ